MGMYDNNHGFIQVERGGVGAGDLHIQNYAGYIRTVNHVVVRSDDRIKINEKHIINGLDIINKLKPYTYEKLIISCDINKLNKDENDYDDKIFESGFIAQEVYYDIQRLDI